MKQIIVWSSLAIFLCCSAGMIFAEEHGTAEEAKANVQKAIVYLKANGEEKTFAEINNPKGQFINKDLYIFVYNREGLCMAHGSDPDLIGSNLFEMQDRDGKFLVQEFIKTVDKSGSGWVDYKWTHPIDKTKILSKSAYVERVDNLVIGCGRYKD